MIPIIESFYGRWAFLSHFYPSVLTYEGIVYPTGEHAYNAAKTLDRVKRYEIAEAATPAKAKKMGRAVELRPLWKEALRYEVMRDVLRAKFTCRPGRVQALLSTGDAVLIEGNYWHDQHWGNCRCGRPQCTKPGLNVLGLLLMELRYELAQEEN